MDNAQKIADKYVQLMSDERLRQIEVEGWTPEHDDTHNEGSLADAAACYAATTKVYRHERLQEGSGVFNSFPLLWPWEPEYLKYDTKTEEDRLIVAGALIIARLDQIHREKMKQTLNLCDGCTLHCSTCGASPKFGTGIGNDNVYECDTFQRQPYQMPCPYGLDSMEQQIEYDPISFAPRHHQKILDRTKIRTARKQDKSGAFTINGERFEAVFEVALTITAFKSLFDSEFYTPQQFGFESELDMWDYYHNYFEDMVYVHKINKLAFGGG